MLLLRKVLLSLSLMVALLATVVLGVALSYRDALTVPVYELQSSQTPISFMLAGDIHNHPDQYADGNSLSAALEEHDPDFLFFSGDMIDSHTTDFSFLDPLLNKARELSIPAYFVFGNHEGDLSKARVEEFRSYMEGQGAIDVEGKTVELAPGYTLSGVADPSLNPFVDAYRLVEQELKDLQGTFDEEDYNIVLCHQPNFSGLMSSYGFDLALSGHTHGGQGQIGDLALFSHSGVFHGLYTRKDFAHVVTAGAGTSYYLPLRFMQTNEFPLIELEN